MASFSGPKLSNRIADDVPDIQAVLSSLAKLTPDSGNTDYPIGTKRVAETTNGYEFQQYNGTGWVTLEKWNLDAQKVDGYNASTGTTANTIPVRNANGKLPGDILGNAATATKANALSETNPIPMGGTGATTAEQARANLGTPPKTHASTSTEYGIGTSTQYGHLKSHDAPDSTLTAATGHAFSPAGAAAMQDVLEGQIGDLTSAVEGNAASQSVKDAEQDAAISAAQSTANAKIASIDMDGLDLVLTYGDGTVKRVQVPAGKSVGDLWFGFDPMSKPANVQTYEGQLLSRAAYVAHSAFVLGGRRKVLSEDAWQEYVAEKGFCPFYSSGDGSTTYRMPLMDRVHPKFVAAWAEAGQYVEAGLPNITGTFAAEARLGSSAPKGAFYYTGKSTEGAVGGGTDHIVGLDASRSSPVYGNSDSVQPPAVTMVVGEYVVGSVATIGEADAESLLAGQTLLDSKVVALENGVGRANAYIVETWRDGTEWYRVWSDGWIEQGGIANGAAAAAGAVISMPMEFANTDYFLSVGVVSAFPLQNSASVWAKYGSKTTTTFKCSTGWSHSTSDGWSSYPVMWQAKGF